MNASVRSLIEQKNPATRQRSGRGKSRHGVHPLPRRLTAGPAVFSTRSDAITWPDFTGGFRSAALPDVQQGPPPATITFASKAITKGSAANCVSEPDRTTCTGKTVRFRARGRRTGRGTASRSCPRPRPPRPKAPGRRAPAPAMTEEPSAGAISDCCSLPFSLGKRTQRYAAGDKESVGFFYKQQNQIRSLVFNQLRRR